MASASQMIILLTHWGRVTHIYLGNLTASGPDDRLSPHQRLAIIWTNTRMLLIGPLGTDFSEFFIGKSYIFIKKCIQNCRLQNGNHFVSTSMCLQFISRKHTNRDRIFRWGNERVITGSDKGLGPIRFQATSYSAMALWDSRWYHMCHMANDLKNISLDTNLFHMCYHTINYGQHVLSNFSMIVWLNIILWYLSTIIFS